MVTYCHFKGWHCMWGRRVMRQLIRWCQKGEYRTPGTTIICQYTDALLRKEQVVGAEVGAGGFGPRLRGRLGKRNQRY